MKRINRNENEQKDVHCSFCGKSQDEVYRLIAGPGVWICNECVDLCNIILADEKGGAAAASEQEPP